MKKFDNIADDGIERALRKGYIVPNGAVNIAYTKGPSLSPKNNVVIVDTSKTISENQTSTNKSKTIAFADVNGILEDINGNQIWDEEYPTISDIFLNPENDQVITDYTADKILPFLHVSRHFHVDFVGLAYSGRLEEYLNQDSIKIVDKRGVDFLDDNGNKKYRVYLIAPSYFAAPSGSVQSVYRVYIFFDTNPEIDELYLTYNKVQINQYGAIINQEFSYQERINARAYYKYLPEESDVADRAQALQKIYSSKPSNLKDQVLGGSQNAVHGWKYFVPRQAIPDPRIFQLFKWRIACEFTRSISQNATTLNPASGVTIKAGVIIPNGGNHLHTNANFFFYQLNETEYNFSNIKFVNPLKSPTLAYSRVDQQTASYWHVNIDTISLADLSQFDILIWAPTAQAVDVSPYIPKINYFTETLGGTFIFESSSSTIFTNLPGGAATSTQLDNILVTPAGDTAVKAGSLRLYDATPNDPNDTFSSYGMWKKWPPNINEILNTYNDTGSILASASVIAGWDLSSDELAHLTGYGYIPNTKFQYIKQYNASYLPVIEGPDVTTPSTFRKTLIHQKFNSGGNVFVSTEALFDDHMFEVNGNLATKSLQIPNISSLDAIHQVNFKKMVSSEKMKAEMKLRLNTMLLATIYKPDPNLVAANATNQGNAQSTIVYGDWNTSWVINPDGGVLSEKEKNDNSFALLPINTSIQAPVWQRILSQSTLQEIVQAKIKQLDPDGTNQIYNTSSGAIKKYFVLVTNPQVQVMTSDQLTGTSIPTAWTTAYSPAFQVPYHMGSYAVRDEMIAGTGVGSGRKLYPPKPYDLQASVSYYTTSNTQGKTSATISLTGTYQQSIKRPDTIEQRSVWVPGTDGYMTDLWMHWNGENGFNSLRPGYQQMGLVSSFSPPPSNPGNSILYIPNGIDTWADANYQTQRTTNWPFMGQFGHLDTGSRGDQVVFVQRVINQLVFFGDIHGPFIKEDGYYGATTKAKILEFQQSRAAQYQDGIVDAETFSLIGFYLLSRLRLPDVGTGLWANNVPTLALFAFDAQRYMSMESISDDNYQSVYGRMSWFKGSPSSISQGFSLNFRDTLLVMEIAVLPWLGTSATNLITCDWVDAGVNLNLAGYNYSNGSPGSVSGLVGADYTTSANIPLDWIHIYFPERMANSVIIRLRQDGPSGYGDARMIGIRDIGVKAKRFTPGTPGFYQTSTVTVPGDTFSTTRTFSYTTNLEFDAGVSRTISPFSANLNPVPPEEGGRTVYGVRWNTNSLVITPAESALSFTSTFTDDGVVREMGLTSNQLTLTYFGYNNTLSAENFLTGPRIGNGSNTYFTKNTSGVINPFSRTYGWVSKEDGVTLICKQDGTPFGLPTALPNQVTYSMHFARYKLGAFNTDQTLYYGFYDINRKEFITNSYGEPEITFYDYIRRGPQNIFIAVQTTYEIDSTYNIPGSTDTVNRPFKWAMPVYGVTTGLESKIQIMPLSEDLGYDDLWALPIKTGSFSKDVALRPRSQGSLTNYLKDYQGYTVKAHYDVPEAKRAAWSALYGRPYTDISGEIPMILDDFTIQIRQYPILIAQQPTLTPSSADPWYPVFTMQRRGSLTDPWFTVPFTDVDDYSIWDGTITLKNRLTSNDPRLIRVSYTSQRKSFLLKYDGVHRLNLNPYIPNVDLQLNKPLYIYLLPEFVIDNNYTTIPSSVQTRTLNMSYSPNIFNSTQVEYNPLALLIGIVYVTNSFDINDLTIIDTRKRGGGANAYYDEKQLFGIQSEGMSYWDVIPTYPTAYQKGGFVLIRLPKALQQDFTEDDIIEVIERNVTVGTRYKIQDLQGNRWEAATPNGG